LKQESDLSEKMRDYVSRRSFMKGTLAFTALSAAAVAGCTPGEVAAESNTSLYGKPMWVRRVDKPTYVIDDSVLTRFDRRNGGFNTAAQAWGPEKTAELNAERARVIQEGVQQGLPGRDLKAQALVNGANATRSSEASKTLYSWTPLRAKHPREAYGVDAWQGTPEENARMVKAACLFYGAGSAGIAELDRRWIYSDIKFEDVEEPNKNEGIIPDRCKYVIAVTIPMSFDLLDLAPLPMSSAGTGQGYSLMPFVVGSIAEFIRALGYTAIPCGNDTGLSVPICIDAGLGEVGRTGRLITPEWGPCVRLAKVITDFPMAVDKPIDFGVQQFCRVCKKCAETCPGEALSFETEPSWEVTGPWNQPGKKVWQEDAAKCLEAWRKLGTGCGTCIRVCPYTKRAETKVHDIIKGTISMAPFMSGLIAKADDWFGYGSEGDPEAWWKMLHHSFGRDAYNG